MSIWRTAGMIGLVLTVATAASAQELVPDSLRAPAQAVPAFPGHSLGHRLWKPALVVSASFFLDQGTRVVSQDLRSGATNDLARVGNGFGNPRYFLPVIGAGVIGGLVFHQPGLTQWGIQTAEAGALAGAAVTVIKEIVGRPRPFQTGDPDQISPFSGYQSFPSGHTTAVAAFATVLAARVHNPWLKGLVYGGAFVTGFARINDDKHWLSDVIVGGLIGHAAGRFVLGRKARPAPPSPPTLGQPAGPPP